MDRFSYRARDTIVDVVVVFFHLTVMTTSTSLDKESLC